MEIAGQQGIGNLPEKVFGGVVPGYVFLQNQCVINPLDYMGLCSTFTVNREGETMATAKTSTLTFRIEPELKEALRAIDCK